MLHIVYLKEKILKGRNIVQDVEKFVDDYIEKQDKLRAGVITPRGVRYYDKFILPRQHCFNERKKSTSFFLNDKGAYHEFFTRF